MTDEYLPRQGKPMLPEDLYPNSAKQKLIVIKIAKILMSKGMLEGTAHVTAIQIWRVVRRA